MRKIFLTILLIGALLFCLVGCEEDIADTVIPQFNMPQNVALICYDMTLDLPQPISACQNSERLDREIYAFVTQTEYGEVAVVSLEDYEIVDQESRIPFRSFIPVGGHPNDIAASVDGNSVYTANFETRDISIINTNEAIRETQMIPAESVNVNYPPAQIVVAADVSDSISADSDTQDKFAFITQPTVGRVAVVNLADPDLPRGVIGWLRLDAATLSGEPGLVDNRPEGIAPTSMIASEKISSLFVAGARGISEDDGSYVVEIQRDIFIDRARRSFQTNGRAMSLEPAEIIVRRMDLDRFTVRDMSIEPELERWMYLVENEAKGVIVLDLQTGELVAVNNWNVMNKEPYSIEVPGIARKVKMVRFSETLAEDESPGPLVFNGTFAVVSTLQSSIYVIDVSVDDRVPDYTELEHSLRSRTDLYTDDDDDDPEPVYPELTDVPKLYGDDEELNHDNPFELMEQIDTETESVVDTATLIAHDSDTMAVAADSDTSLTVVDTETDTETGTDTDTQKSTQTGSDSETADTTDAEAKSDETDTSAVALCEEGENPFRIENSYNVQFRCDRRNTINDTWTLTYEGSIGISGAGIWDREKSIWPDGTKEKDMDGTPPTSIVLYDQSKNYCEAGLLGPDRGGDLWGSNPVLNTAGLYERYRGYKGDIVEITSLPSPFPADVDCSEYENENRKLWYQVSNVVDKRRIEIVKLPGAMYARLPRIECFSQVVSYRVRANDSWILSGYQAGRSYEGSTTDDGQCVPWEQDGESYSWKSSRVFEGYDFENQYMKFHMGEVTVPGQDATKEDYEFLAFVFNTDNGYEPMFTSLGGDITDIELAPNNDLIVIDQLKNGLVVFDLIDDFNLKNDPIN